MNEHGQWRNCLVALAMLIAVVGCQSMTLTEHAKITFAEDAANVYMSAYPAVPWSDIADKLDPKNNLTTEQARAMAAQTTQIQVAQFLSTFAAGLSIGLPTTASTGTTTIGTTSAQRTATRTESSGTVPSSSGTPQASLTNATLVPDLTKAPPTTGIDASTLLTAGTALYQQGQILDNQISKGFLPEGYQAHLLTLQVNVQPKQRDVSYDAYIDVSFFPGSWREAIESGDEVNQHEAGLPAVVVYPLIIMDALETTNVGRSIEAIRQAALQLAGTIGPVGISGGAAGGTTRTGTIVGLDKNSLVTVGRVSDHTVRIRLGAENSGSAGLALVPRAYNVSLMVLTRWETKAEKTKQRVTSLEAITHTALFSTEDGSVLHSRVKREVLAGSVAEKVKNYGFGAVQAPCVSPGYGSSPETSAKTGVRSWWSTSPPAPVSTLTAAEVEANLELLRAVDRGDYKRINDCLGLDLKSELAISREIALRRLLAELIEIQIESRYAKLHIPLKGRANPTLPDVGQLALYSDNKKQSSVVLRGGKGLNLRQLQAKLEVGGAPKEGTAGNASIPSIGQLLPMSISMTGDGAEIAIVFPSLTLAGLAPSSSKPLYLAIGETTTGSAHYAIRKTDTKEEATNNPVSASSSVLVVDQSNVARVTLQVGKVDGSKIKGPLRLVVDGADVREDKTIGSAATSSKGIPVTAETVITLELGNVVPARLVKITTFDGGSDPAVAIGDALVFTVDRAANTGK